ncbi:MAG: cytochrome c3 family protein [Planctomycetia bacterium]|nr:cytochrome c3 family protein [Planctomycetia bacterium]
MRLNNSVIRCYISAFMSLTPYERPESHLKLMSGRLRLRIRSRFFRPARGWAIVLVAVLVASCVQSGEQGETEQGPDGESSSAGAIGSVAAPDARWARGLIGSAHDFRQADGAALDLCTPCHTPHVSLGKAPLLDRRPQVYQAAQSYEARGVELDASSLLCLSCHDGITARDVYGYAHAVRGPGKIGGSWIGTGSLTSHPIGAKYPLTEPTYHDPASVTASGRIKLPDGRVQCISCHDPHNSHRVEGMLVDRNDASRLCLACHRL